jgi:hypothetical protein
LPQAADMLERLYGKDYVIPRPSANQCTDDGKMKRFVDFVRQNKQLAEMYRL